jgi:hypothetical protein
MSWIILHCFSLARSFARTRKVRLFLIFNLARFAPFLVSLSYRIWRFNDEEITVTSIDMSLPGSIS